MDQPKPLSAELKRELSKAALTRFKTVSIRLVGKPVRLCGPGLLWLGDGGSDG